MEETQKIHWKVDPDHSNICFAVNHLQLSQVEGNFLVFNGDVYSTDESFREGVFELNIEANSIKTSNEIRDRNLRSGNFLEVEKYPIIHFISKEFNRVVGMQYQLKGEVTIKNTTRPLNLIVDFFGVTNDASGRRKAGFKVTGTIQRFDFDVAFQRVIEGILDVGLDVMFVCNTELIKVEGI